MKLLKILGIMAIFLSPVSASAHAGVVSTSPTQDQILTEMPEEIRIEFSEELLTITDREVNTISLTAFDGPPVEISTLKVDGATLSAMVDPGQYAPGTYEVSYRVISADGHEVSDSFTFSLNAAPQVIRGDSAGRDSEEDGVIPPPILISIVIATIVAGFFALRSRKR